ncbi:MAG: gliding motility-associated C-terminal domain-containing protein [Bacteroidota bacterium]
MAAGGTAPFQYSLDSLTYQPTGEYLGLLAGLYQVVVVDDSGCVQMDTFSITQPDSLELISAEVIPVACFGESNGEISLEGTGGVLPYEYGLNGGSLQGSNLFDGLETGYYSVQLVDANGCDANQDSIFVSQPDTLIATTVSDSVRCFGEANGSATVEITGGSSPYALQWDDPAFQTDFEAVGLLAGTYQVAVIDSNGCVATATQEVQEPLPLEISLINFSDAFCDWDNGIAEVAATGGVGGYRFEWTTTPPSQGPRQTNLTEGSYLVQLFDQNACLDTLSFRLGNTPPATASFTGSPNPADTILLSQASIQFQNTSEGAVAYEWDFGALGALSDEENPSFTYQEPGEYDIRLRAFNEFFVCPTDTTIRLVVIPDGVIYFPNAFSPNGDGNNDEFYLGWEGVVTFEMIIFDRWGKEIVRTNQADYRWDGYMPGGGPVPEGVYVFVVRATLNNGTRQERSGSVTLIR